MNLKFGIYNLTFWMQNKDYFFLCYVLWIKQFNANC